MGPGDPLSPLSCQRTHPQNFSPPYDDRAPLFIICVCEFGLLKSLPTLVQKKRGSVSVIDHGAPNGHSQVDNILTQFSLGVWWPLMR